MLPLLKTTTPNGSEFVFTNIENWRLKSENVEGDGSGVAENGDKILDIRARDMVTINATFSDLDIGQYTSIMELLNTDSITLTFWRGYYTTAVFAIDSVESELMKSEQRPNTRTNNRWQVTAAFVQIKANREA